jgi:hypothetical protein
MGIDTTQFRYSKKRPKRPPKKKPVEKWPPGRPREYDRDALLKSLLEYIDATEIPIIVEWARAHGIIREKLYTMPELSDALKLCIMKKEAALERAGLENRMNVSMAIMSLKQLGWSDRREIEHDVTPQSAQTFADLVKSARSR